MSEGRKSGPPPRSSLPPKYAERETAFDRNARAVVDPAAVLRERRFDHRAEPPAVRSIYTLAGQIVATPGNLVAVASAVKTGKSAVIGAMCASAMSAEGDALGFASSNPDGRAVLWFDSEQSPHDFWHCVDRAMKRVGLSEPPEWLRAYCLTGLQQEAAWACVRAGLVVASADLGGVHSVLLDGIADFVKDPNDAGECNSFIASLHDLAIEHDCPIVGVIHFNPGGDKTRGHLGSQFERKAETNLRLDKEDDVTEIWSQKQRRAPIPKGSGPCFAWSDRAGMHVSVQNPSESKAEAKAESKLVAMREAAERVFAQAKASSLAHKELVELLRVEFDLQASGARRRVERWLDSGIVSKSDSGAYSLA